MKTFCCYRLHNFAIKTLLFDTHYCYIFDRHVAQQYTGNVLLPFLCSCDFYGRATMLRYTYFADILVC